MVSSCVGFLFFATISLSYSFNDLNQTHQVVELDAPSDDLLIASPDGFEQADYSFGAMPFPDEIGELGNGQGITISTSSGNGFLLYGPVVNTGNGLIRIRCTVRCEDPNVSLALAALNAPADGGLEDIDGSLGTNQPANGAQFAGTWKTLELFYNPDGDAVVPVFQAVGTSSEPAVVYIDRIAITALRGLAGSELNEALDLYTPTPTVTPTPPPESGSLTFRAYIDGIDHIHIQGNRLWYEHLLWAKPGLHDGNNFLTTIDGDDWQPSWFGDTSNEYLSDEPLIQTGAGYFYTVDVLEGRGTVGLIQVPNSENNYETIVRVDDDDGAASWYEFTLNWSETPPYDVNENEFYWAGKMSLFQDAPIDIHGSDFTVYQDFFGSVAATAAAFGGPLPGYSVNLTAEVLQGNITVAIPEQPRPWNDFTARAVVEWTYGGSSTQDVAILFRWGEEVEPEPTATPWPTWDVNAPSPTPIGGSPKVLWIVMERSFPEEGDVFHYDFMEFGKIFEEAGAVNNVVIAGDQPVTDELLAGYTAVVFGDTRNLSPLTADETMSVLNYVRGGGSIFVIGQQDSESLLEPPSIYATSITKPFGIEFSVQTYGRAEFLADHPLLYNVTELTGGGSELLVESPAEALATVTGDKVVFAIAEEGYGRVAAYSDEMLLFSDELDPFGNRYSYNSRQFAKNIAYWLLKKEDVISATPTPPPGPYLHWQGELETNYGVSMEIQGSTVTLDGNRRDYFKTTSAIFSEPLPGYSVDVSAYLAQGNGIVVVIEQPRPWNNYTAKLSLSQSRIADRMEQFLVVTWGDEIIPENTPTPWPTWNANEPSPTPIQGTPKVLWVVMDRAFQVGLTEDDFTEFASYFEDLGAVNTHIIAGSQPITQELLDGYAAVVFGDTRSVDPLSESERMAVVDYVRSGGSIFVIGQQDDNFVLEPSAIYATSITEPFGIQFSTSASGIFRNFEDHPLVTRVYQLFGAGGSKLLVEPPAQAIGYTDGDDVILAAAEDGYGRVVAFSDEMGFFSSDSIWGGLSEYSHSQFAHNVAAWLLHLESTHIPTYAPTSTPRPTYTPSPTPTFDPNATPTPTFAPMSLLDRYPTTLTEGDNDPTNAREWEMTASDVYHLTEFHFSVGEELNVDTGEADIGIGHCTDGAVFAVLIPRESGVFNKPDTYASEEISHIWLRLHPADLNTLFPPDTVRQDGDTSLLAEMLRIANGKFSGSWHAGDRAMIPPPGNYTFDADTENRMRRFFVVDTVSGTAEYISAFENRPLPAPVPVDGDLSAYIFDTVWDAYDREYAMFIIRPEVDWDQLRDEYRPRALETETQFELASTLAEMLANLRDLHIWITVDGSYVPVYSRSVVSNVNVSAYDNVIGRIHDVGDRVQWGITDDNIGFLAIHSWSDDAIPAQVDRVLEELKDTDSLIVDVRTNAGGSETLARQVAGRFVDSERIYAYHQYRNGNEHTDLGPMNTRSFGPSGSWRYEKPVILLIGQRCMSSNEAFVMMMDQCPQVTMMGDRTRGSSGNPRVIELPQDITVSLPRWIAYESNQEAFDEKGIWPDVWFEPEPGSFTGTHDDLLSAALDRLRETVEVDANALEPVGAGVSGG